MDGKFWKRIVWLGLSLAVLSGFGYPGFASARPASAEEKGRYDRAFRNFREQQLDRMRRSPLQNPVFSFDEYNLIRAGVKHEDQPEKSIFLFYEVSMSDNSENKKILIVQESEDSMSTEPVMALFQIFPKAGFYSPESVAGEADKLAASLGL